MSLVIRELRAEDAARCAELEEVLFPGDNPWPRQVFVVNELPKTRSGKIMRRLLRDVAEGREVGDTTTLADTSVMQIITDQLR